MKIVSIPPGDLGLCGFSFVHYLKKCFTQIYRALYGDAILVLMQMGGHQHGDPGADLGGGCRGCAPLPEITHSFLIQLVFFKINVVYWC